jgi:hypothetical protein
MPAVPQRGALKMLGNARAGSTAGRRLGRPSGGDLERRRRRVGLPQRHHGPVPSPPWGEAGAGIAPEIHPLG